MPAPPTRSARAARRGTCGASGVAKIEGFFLNATHFDWTSHEIRYGQQISRMTGGKHFVVNTGENGRGPLRPQDIVHQGNEVLCNPPRARPRAAAHRRAPATATSTCSRGPATRASPAARCVPGAPPTGVYWPAYAKMLVQNADFKVRLAGERAVAAASRRARSSPTPPRARRPSGTPAGPARRRRPAVRGSSGERRVRPGLRVAVDATRQRARAVAELDPVDAGAGAVQASVADRHAFGSAAPSADRRSPGWWPASLSST